MTATAYRLDALDDKIARAGALVAEHTGAKGGLARFKKWENDPVGFVRDVLKAELWSKQEEMATLVRDHPLVVVRGANGSGKDHAAARIVLWHVYCRGGLAVVLAPTERQVKEIFFGELRRAFMAARTLPGSLYELALRADKGGHAGVLGYTSNDVSRLTGLHAPRLMVVLSECQGLEPFAWEGALACSTGADSKVLATGNPLSTSGRFYEVSRNAQWASVRISAFDHPNLVQQREVIPGGCTQAFVSLMTSEYGLGSGIFRARVLGDWPDGDDDALVRRSWLELAAARWEGRGPEGAPALPDWGINSDGEPYTLPTSDELRVAVDPARFGSDQTALCIVQGPVVRELVVWSHADTMETAGRVIVELEQRKIDPREASITIDEVGLGAGVVDRLREVGCRNVEAFNGGRTALNPGQFLNRRAETYWAVRRALEEGKIAVPRDAKLWDELCATRWRPNSRGQVMLESKDDLKARLGRSPDRADAVAMALAPSAPRSEISFEYWEM